MHRIEKNLNFFKKYLYFIFAFFWILIAFAYYFLTDGRVSVFIAALYLITGVLYVFLAYKQRHRNTEYIAWDNEKLIVSRLHQKPKTYAFGPKLNICLSNYHLIIKAPKASGDMVELKGFSEEDLDLLRDKFGKPAVA